MFKKIRKMFKGVDDKSTPFSVSEEEVIHPEFELRVNGDPVTCNVDGEIQVNGDPLIYDTSGDPIAITSGGHVGIGGWNPTAALTFDDEEPARETMIVQMNPNITDEEFEDCMRKLLKNLKETYGTEKVNDMIELIQNEYIENLSW